MNLLSVSIVLHLLSAVIWVGGMFFAHRFLRPVAASQLEPPVRLTLWRGVFAKFFPFVWLSVVLLPLTGYFMMFSIWQTMAATPLYVHLMNGLGILMILIYLHVYFAPYKRLCNAVAMQDWPAGGKALNQIRQLVGVNMSIGLLVMVIVSGGRYFG
ncbi:MAG: hypothetical protein EP315_04860 [Gammaproteobacteria bacterium]|nr:MAG: hypothetical protein EP315_04860 [Gammaproteobacteria bacterium]